MFLGIILFRNSYNIDFEMYKRIMNAELINHGLMKHIIDKEGE